MSLESSIHDHAAHFIRAAGLKAEWPQEAHVAFVTRVLKAELGLEEEQVAALLEIGTAMPALLANASAFRQKLQSKDWGLLETPPKDGKGGLGNRYAGYL